MMLCKKGLLFCLKSIGKVVVLHTMQAQGRVALQHHLFLTSTLGGSEWSSSHSSHFTHKEGVLYTLWIVGWGSLSTWYHDGYHHWMCGWKWMCWCHSHCDVFTWHGLLVNCCWQYYWGCAMHSWLYQTDGRNKIDILPLPSYMHRVHLLAIYLRFFTGQTNPRSVMCVNIFQLFGLCILF